MIPPKLDTLQRIIFYEDCLENLVDLKFSTIHKSVIEKQNQFYDWSQATRPRNCPSRGYVLEIQQALVKKGYKVPINNIFCKETKAALIQFQKDNHLQIGQLGVDTLEMLGVRY